MKDLVIIGAGAHGRIVAETAAESGTFRILGFADDNPTRHGGKVDDWNVLGCWQDIDTQEYIIGIGDNSARHAAFDLLQTAGKPTAIIISPRAIVSRKARIGTGTVILAGAIIQAGAHIGKNVIVNVGAVLDHDARVCDHAHIGPNAVVSSFGYVNTEEVIAAGSVRSKPTCALPSW